MAASLGGNSFRDTASSLKNASPNSATTTHSNRTESLPSLLSQFRFLPSGLPSCPPLEYSPIKLNRKEFDGTDLRVHACYHAHLAKRYIKHR